MRKSYWLLIPLFLFLPALCIVCMAANNSSDAPVRPTPKITTIIGSGNATLESANYPEFTSYNAPGYETCGEHLKTLNGTSKGTNSTFQIIPGMEQTISIPAEYRSHSRLLFTWTIRIETGPTSAVSIAPALCTYFVGTSYQRFTGGEVQTQLFINGTAIPPIATMTVPGTATAETSQSVAPPPPPARRDPTLTGSCLIAPSDLGFTAFPETLKVDVRWLNLMGGFSAVSPDQMRELIVTIIPQ